jgi:hypothetical protein
MPINNDTFTKSNKRPLVLLDFLDIFIGIRYFEFFLTALL